MHRPKTVSPTAMNLGRIGLFIMLLGFITTGCRHGNAINFVTNTQFGVKAGVDSQHIPEVNIGYSRQEFARVPVYVERQNGGSTTTRSQPEITAILKQAQIFLTENTKDVDLAKKLIEEANSTTSKADKAVVSPIFRLIADKAKNLTPQSCPDDRKLLSSLIDAELAYPREVQTFLEQGKFIGIHDSQSSSDAYSVLGTFNGDGSGRASGTNGIDGKVTIAQFFATGVAAQILAQTGGAATVNPKAPAPGLTADQRKEAEEKGTTTGKTQVRNLDKVAKFILGKGDDDGGKRKERALKVLIGVKEVPDSLADDLSKLTSTGDIKDRLFNYADQSDIMIKNIN